MVGSLVGTDIVGASVGFSVTISDGAEVGAVAGVHPAKIAIPIKISLIRNIVSPDTKTFHL
jgi:hypothetical protein